MNGSDITGITGILGQRFKVAFSRHSDEKNIAVSCSELFSEAELTRLARDQVFKLLRSHWGSSQ